MFNVTYQGITHSCDDPGCHVIGFVRTLLEHDSVESLVDAKVLRLVPRVEEDEDY